MALDRRLADDELLGDLTGGQSARQQPQDLALTPGEWLQPGEATLAALLLLAGQQRPSHQRLEALVALDQLAIEPCLFLLAPRPFRDVAGHRDHVLHASIRPEPRGGADLEDALPPAALASSSNVCSRPLAMTCSSVSRQARAAAARSRARRPPGQGARRPESPGRARTPG